MTLNVYTDGASRGNPGFASYGFVIISENGQVLHKAGAFLGVATNNVAEYTAVAEAFEFIKKQFKNHIPLRIKLFADSLLVVQQLSGKYKVKNLKLKILFDQIKILELSLGRIFYNYIPREKNKLADFLANQAIDNMLNSPSF